MVLGRLQIMEGPGRYDLILGSLMDGWAVRFGIGPQNLDRLFIQGVPVLQFWARIFRAGRTDLGEFPSSALEFFLNGEVLSPSGSGQLIGLVFSGVYNTNERHGIFEFERRPYKAGDAVGAMSSSGAVGVAVSIK